MPKVRLSYFGAIRAAAGKPEEETEFLADTTVYQLLRNLAGIHGGVFLGEIFEKNEFREDITITVNDMVVSHADLFKTILKPGDKLALLPIFPGGG